MMKQKMMMVIMVIALCSGWHVLQAAQPLSALQPDAPEALPVIMQNVSKQTTQRQILAAPQDKDVQKNPQEGTLMKPGQIMKDIGGVTESDESASGEPARNSGDASLTDIAR